MKDETDDFVEVVDLLSCKYRGVKGDELAFVAGLITGLNVGVHLISHGVLVFNPRICALISECDYDFTSLGMSLQKLNVTLPRKAAISTKLYVKEELRRSIYMKAYQDGVYLGLHCVSMSYKRYVDKKCSVLAILSLLPRYIDRRKNVLLKMLKEVSGDSKV